MGGEMKINAILIDGGDDVATLLCDIAVHEPIAWDSENYVVAREPIPEGHKVALREIATGAVVLKYGHPIGKAARDIARGEHVHTHNLAREES
jgi:hypothetical protein